MLGSVRVMVSRLRMRFHAYAYTKQKLLAMGFTGCLRDCFIH